MNGNWNIRIFYFSLFLLGIYIFLGNEQFSFAKCIAIEVYEHVTLLTIILIPIISSFTYFLLFLFFQY